jgi:hypothetical protein
MGMEVGGRFPGAMQIVAHQVDPVEIGMNLVQLVVAGSDGGADKVVLNLGSYFDTVVCYLEDAPIKITHWSPTMAPVRAEVSVSLVEVNPVTVFSDEVSNFDYEGYVR